MYRLIRDNVVKLTPDPGKRDRLVADGYTWEQGSVETPPETVPGSAEAPAEKNDKPAKGKAAADGNGTNKA